MTSGFFGVGEERGATGAKRRAAEAPSRTRKKATEMFALNEEQRAAVEHGEGPLLVIAGAGTGKTRVITERIRMLLESDAELAGENILGLTFTDKAAGEMKYRVVKSVGERAAGVWLGTFHGFCMEKILRAKNPELQPIDEVDHWILLRRNIAELELEHFKRLADPGEFLNDFVTFFSRCQDELVSCNDYQRHVDGLRRSFATRKRGLEPDLQRIEEEELARQEELARAYRVSERLLREKDLITFGAQLMQTVELLRADEALVEQLREQYRYILVDEFQDTNIAQLELLYLLAGDRRNIVAVGDDDQAIYRFRGASFGSFTIFLQRFCGVSESRLAAGKIRNLVSLTQNYRSTQRILRVAGEVISMNEKSPLLPPKKLKTDNPEGERIRVAEFGTPDEEAWWVTSEIERLQGPGNPWRNFAVLYRKHTHRDKLLEALRRRGIPFVIKRFSILSSTIVRDLIAYLRLIDSPADNVSCARVLAAPYWGLEPRDLVRLAERAEKNGRRPISDELDAAQGELPFSREGCRLTELVSMLKRLRQLARIVPATDLLDELIRSLEVAPLSSDADHFYLDRLALFVRAWELKNEEERLHAFIEYLDFFEQAGGDICLEDEPSDDAVQLMTVHSAKGLEFPHVFILHVNKNEFPARPRPVVFEFPTELMKEEKPEGDFQKQEERRLFYVALTRAKQRLTLSTIINKYKKPSPFLEDFLAHPQIQRYDTAQSAPKVELPPAEEVAAPAPEPEGSLPLFRNLDAGETRAYSRVALWAKSYFPPCPEPLQLSASAIEQYEKCPMQYLFARMWRIRGGPSAAMTFGNAMHTTIKEFVGEIRKRRKISLDEMMTIYEREWLTAGYADDYHQEEYRKAGCEQLAKLYETFRLSPPDVLHQEKSFELALDKDVIVKGRMDQVNRFGHDEIEIVDYKTGSAKDFRKADKSLQLSIYAIAAEEVLELKPARLVFYNLTTNEAVATSRDAKQLACAKQAVAEVADRIRAKDFAPKPGYQCKSCEFEPLCPAHEQLISIAPMSRGIRIT